MQVDKFYDTHYEDYRAHLALRIKALLNDFWVKHSNRLSKPPFEVPSNEEKMNKKDQSHKPIKNASINQVARNMPKNESARKNISSQ